jgi:hypothetical protein
MNQNSTSAALSAPASQKSFGELYPAFLNKESQAEVLSVSEALKNAHSHAQRRTILKMAMFRIRTN